MVPKFESMKVLENEIKREKTRTYFLHINVYMHIFVFHFIIGPRLPNHITYFVYP